MKYMIVLQSSQCMTKLHTAYYPEHKGRCFGECQLHRSIWKHGGTSKAARLFTLSVFYAYVISFLTEITGLSFF